jgi:hypothetical protein
MTPNKESAMPDSLAADVRQIILDVVTPNTRYRTWEEVISEEPLGSGIQDERHIGELLKLTTGLARAVERIAKEFDDRRTP